MDDNNSSKQQITSKEAPITSVVINGNNAITKIKTDNGYDPFANRNVAHPTSTVGAFFHLLKSSLGSGLLAMPAAFKHTGLVYGTIGTFLVAFIATHCVQILVRTSQEICKEVQKPSLSYADTCEAVFKHGPKRLRGYSNFVRYFMDYSMAGVCLGGTSIYIMFIASSIKDLCDHFLPEKRLSIEIFCLILLLPLMLITQFRYLKFLVPFSVFANACLGITVCITCYYCLTDIPDISQRSLTANVGEWPMFISTAIFAMEGINVVMPVENEMAHPEHFLGCPGILNFTMTFVALLYSLVGLLGYVKFGNDVRGSVTLNLPQGEPLAIAAITLVAVAVLFTYCLQMYVPVDIIWNRLQDKIIVKYHNISQVVLRIICVGLSVIMAVVVPDLEILIGLVGAIFFSTLGLLTPTVVETVHKWDRGLGTFKWILWKNIILLLFYLVVLVAGCYTSIRDIVAKFNIENVR